MSSLTLYQRAAAAAMVTMPTTGQLRGTVPVDKRSLAPGGGTGDDAYDWATEGNDDLPVPTGKVNLDSVQSQIDDIHEQIAHSEGAITSRS